MPAPFTIQPAPKSGKSAVYETFRGVDWSMSIHRPGCQDFLKHPSLRGGERYPHRPPIGMRGASKEVHRYAR